MITEFRPVQRDGRTVPYITRWDSEQNISAQQLFLSSERLSYIEEDAEDRDRSGVLYERTSGDYGTGNPEWRQIHPLRQRHAMTDLLCQVCAQPPSRTKKGWLFLIPGRATPTALATLEGQPTTHPPLCRPCAKTALEQCPRLKHVIAVRARKCPLWGVLGVVHLPASPGMHHPATRRLDATTVQYGTRTPGGLLTTRFILASQLLRQLHRVTVVDLDAELALAA
ncbi:hypothetical protein [Streptomyces smyrnaeus]|uniref:hypothetical protein n=1 Tax=Streptomyces smyrnaeus TaxID=1387713 RepID=UPI00117EE8CF